MLGLSQCDIDIDVSYYSYSERGSGERQAKLVSFFSGYNPCCAFTTSIFEQVCVGSVPIQLS